MDAVTHAMEALLVPPVPKNLPSTGFHPLCDGAALQALRAINNNIERAVKHGKEDIVSRAEMQVAAALAGKQRYDIEYEVRWTNNIKYNNKIYRTARIFSIF